MMDAVKIIECPRDAWQGLKRQIPTLQKVEYLRRLVDAGFRHIDAVSFVSPKVVPQMADSEAVVEQLGPLEGVEIIGIVVNEKGADRAIATGAVSTLGYPCSISETFLRKNQNQSREENYEVLETIKRRADAPDLAGGYGRCRRAEADQSRGSSGDARLHWVRCRRSHAQRARGRRGEGAG